ncbi:MAG: hypothetical protein JRF33_21130 [Deltaproteobacteria bacterium]|nr:hypothetical protein [Deltaproteobacteria bacterium]
MYRAISFLCLVVLPVVGCGSEAEVPAREYEVRVVEGQLLGERLVEGAREALQVVPAWLHDDLAVSLSRLAGSDQRRWASLILDADDRFIDEIAFVVAHSAKADLRNSLIDPQLLHTSTRSIYERAAELPYVELLEGPDYTTLRYAGPAGPVELPPEIYYWYVVHPRLEDEPPIFLDPESNSTQAPPAGKFWRESFYAEAGELCPTDLWCSEDPWATAGPCPVLRDMLMVETSLWEGKQDNMTDNGAVGAVMRWVRESMCFGADGERPVQPMRIYHLHRGNCGEWADMTAAALRSALIPAVNVAAYANDHTWNEFHDGLAWHQIEPVNAMVDSPRYDKDGPEGSGWWWLYATYTSRGDGWTINNQDFYSDQNCLLEVMVRDAAGRPVEGARVITGTWRLGFVPHFLGLSDADGRVAAVLGDQNEYNLMVLSPLGDVGAESPVKVIEVSEPGVTYTWEVDLAERGPEFTAGPAEMPELGDYRFELAYDFPSRVLHAGGLVAGLEFALKREGGRVHVALLAPEDCDAAQAGGTFDAHLAPTNESGSFGLDLAEPAGWCVLLSNETSLIASSTGLLRIELLQKDVQIFSQELEVLLRPGERFLLELKER